MTDITVLGKDMVHIHLRNRNYSNKARKDARVSEVVYNFYKVLKALVAECNFNDKPQFVFNTYESSFGTDFKCLKVIVKRENL